MTGRMADRMAEISPFYVMTLLQRAKELEKQGRDIIHMEIGEPDFPTPAAIVKAGMDFIQKGDVKYTPASGLPLLREKVAEFYQQQYGVKVAKERIFITPGASGAFLLALGATLNPNEELLMSDPCYPCNSNFVRLFNGKTRFVPVNADNDYQLTAQAIRDSWQSNTKGVICASPSNPTGTIIKAEVLKQSIEAVNELNGCFFSDEIYHGLIYDEKATSALEFSDDVFVINSFSKNFGMTGWRIGWLIVPEEFIEATNKLAQNIFIATSTHSQYAALAAFEAEAQQELENRRQELSKRRDFLYQKLQDLGFEMGCKPQGAFYIYANCAKFSDDSFQFAHDLLEKEGVAITPGKDFGTNDACHHLRFAYTTSINKMAEAMTRLETFLEDYK
ncbi:MAG: pyridoxal phosphate-dependent aminotransferase [Methylococcaceae bacterium]|nr:pyridoxal phosphate-dependent aminotransferase [Methylococcaceae bacterium]